MLSLLFVACDASVEQAIDGGGTKPDSPAPLTDGGNVFMDGAVVVRDGQVIDTDSLRAKTSAGLPHIGVAVANAPLTDDAAYAALLAKEFNSVTHENSMKWSETEPAAANFSFANADAILDAAESNGQMIRGHTLVWHNQLPGWVSGLNENQLRTAMRQHIDTLVGRYKGRVEQWDVVNEAIDDNLNYRSSPFLDRMGEGYIEEAFRRAHAADPAAKLYYNDYGIAPVNPKSNVVYDMLKDLVNDGVPIHGVGIQGHLTAYELLSGITSIESMRTNIRRFAALGLDVYLTELDIKLADLNYGAQQKLLIQRELYRQLTDLCREEPGCVGITIWGLTDKYSWHNNEDPTHFPLLFDDAIARKPAYYGVSDGLTGKAGTALPNVNTSCGAGPLSSATFCDPMESKTLSAWSVETSGGGQVSPSGTPHKGDLALRTTSGGNGATAFAVRRIFNDRSSGKIWMRAYVRVPGNGALDGLVAMSIGSDLAPDYPGVSFNLSNGTMLSAGTVQLYSTITNESGDSNYAMPRNSWQCVEMEIDVKNSGGSVKLYVGGTQRAQISNADTLPATGYDNATAGVVWTSNTQGSVTIEIDEFAVGTQRLPCD